MSTDTLVEYQFMEEQAVPTLAGRILTVRP